MEAAEEALSSFAEIRDRVYASPCPVDKLPDYEGASDWETIQALFLSIVSERITLAMKRTLAEAADFKEDRPKLFHPKGVCAEAQWEITAQTDYTGLFAPGARVPAIVRMSASGNNTRYRPLLLHSPRSFGLALKLFPATSPNEPAHTANLLLFDHTGVDGNPSPWYMRGAPYLGGGFGEQYFLNWMHGNGPVTSGFARLFSRFATDVRYRAIDAMGRSDAAGRAVNESKSPRFVRLVPIAQFPQEARWEDFRLEILALASLGPLAFDIFASERNPVDPGPRTETKIGRLTLGEPVVSEFGDRQLHFSHRR